MPKKMHHLLGNRDWLSERIEAGRSQKQIAEEAGTKAPNVAHYVRKHGLIVALDRSERMKQSLAERYPNGRKGPLAGHWKGGRMSTTGSKAGGYIRIYKPDHPAANHAGYVYEHRLVMEAKLGRFLEKGEIVDHIDRNRSNNAPENLRLHASRSQHVKDHFSARDQLVALVAKIRALEVLTLPTDDGFGTTWELIKASDLNAVLDEAMSDYGG